MNQAPHVFLSSASEDKELAVRLAKDLLAHGIDTFNYIWDIKMGESFRQRIDEGIINCTHFLVLLTPVSIVGSTLHRSIIMRRISIRSYAIFTVSTKSHL